MQVRLWILEFGCKKTMFVCVDLNIDVVCNDLEL